MKTEAAIQQEIVVWYRNNYCLKNHDPRNIIFSVPNEGKNAIEQLKKVNTGMMAGVSDLIVVHFGKIMFIECKDEKGKQSEKQKDFEYLIKSQGFEYHLVRSLDDFKLKIK